MSKQLKKLISLLKELNHPEFKKIAYLSNNYKKAKFNEEKITISLDELQSLIDSEYDFSRTEIGFIGIEKK